MTSLHRTPLTTSQKIECVAKALAGPEDGGGIAGLSPGLVRIQNFFGKGKAPPTLIENRELGLFFYGGATTVRSTEQGWLRRASIAGYSDSAKANSDLFCHLYSVEIGAVADGVLFEQCYKQWIKPDPAAPTGVQIEWPAAIS